MPRKSTVKVEDGVRPTKAKAPHAGDEEKYTPSLGKEPDHPPLQELFPPYEVPTPQPLTATEKAQVAAFREFRDRIHRGPLYTVLGEKVRVSKSRTQKHGAPIITDPFDGVETYSQRYKEHNRTLPKLDTRSYALKFFPKELWSTLDPSISKNATKRSKRKPQVSTARLSKDGAEEGDNAGVKKDSEDEDGEGTAPQDPEQLEKVMDDTFETDEDEMAGDYNAEGYFDDGGEDAGDDYDAGDGDDGAFY